jgi:exosortase K
LAAIQIRSRSHNGGKMNSNIRKQLTGRLIAQAAAVFAIALALKMFYSTSSVNELRWILAPTTRLVEIITGERFWFESYAGYMNADRSFLIADSCSGMNFLITAFLMLGLMKLGKGLTANVSWSFIPVIMAGAYDATNAANTVRITVAMRLHRMSPEMIWINPEQAHRLQGIFIYFGFLLFLFIIARNFDASDRHAASQSGLLRQSMIPLSLYWFVTLGIPILNGAYHQGAAFREHSLFVLLAPVILILPLAAVRWFTKRRGRERDLFRYS